VAFPLSSFPLSQRSPLYTAYAPQSCGAIILLFGGSVQNADAKKLRICKFFDTFYHEKLDF
jgi:hypothetical protein